MSAYSERPWLKNYPSGVPANINTDEFLTVNDFIEESLKKYADRIAFTSFGTHIKYKILDKKSKLFAAYLISRGLKAGDRIALMMPNILQYPIALLGSLRAGLIVVNTNPLYTPREMAHQFTDSGVKAIVIADNFAANLQKIIAETDIDVVITTTIGEMIGLKGKMIDTVLKLKGKRPAFELTNSVGFTSAISAGKKFSIPEFDDAAERVIIHQYTGGTTGVSKGAMLTNKNLIANMLQIRALLKPAIQTEEAQNVLCPLPLYHIFAFTVNCLSMIADGHRNILVVNPRDIGSLVKEFKKYPIHITTGVNTLFNAMLHNKDFVALDHSNLKISLGGGAAVQVHVATKWKEVTGCQLTEGYGLTESSPVASVNPIFNARLGTIGLPVSSTDMRIVDQNGQEVPIGERGEIQIHGPQVMKGYYNQPEATAEVIKDGWLSTGDIGIMEPDGFFKVVDRKKDMILVSGFNVFPNEVEDIVGRHPKVLEVAAIGIPSEKSGECVKIFVVKKDKSLKDKELIQYCRENLTAYKVPKEVEFLKELPKSNVGKILRRKLRNQ